MKFSTQTKIEDVAPKTRGSFRRWQRIRQMPVSERFWKKIKVGNPDECWPWLGAKDNYGYGFWHPEGDGTKRWKTHRLAWVYTFGPIPDGMLACHRCDNPICANPYHLFLGTHKDNSQDMKRKGRDKYKKGEESPTAKLTELQVREIRAMYRPKTIGWVRGMAKQFGISVPQIWAIVRRKKWRHVV